MYVTVNPTATYPTLTSVDYLLLDWVAHTSVSFKVTYNNDIGVLIDTRTVIIDGADYTAWGVDDDYILDLMLTKSGLTKTI